VAVIGGVPPGGSHVTGTAVAQLTP